MMNGDLIHFTREGGFEMQTCFFFFISHSAPVMDIRGPQKALLAVGGNKIIITYNTTAASMFSGVFIAVQLCISHCVLKREVGYLQNVGSSGQAGPLGTTAACHLAAEERLSRQTQ